MEWKKTKYISGYDFYRGPNGERLYENWTNIRDISNKGYYTNFYNVRIGLEGGVAELSGKVISFTRYITKSLAYEITSKDLSIKAHRYPNADVSSNTLEMNKREIADFCDDYAIQLECAPIELKTIALRDLNAYKMILEQT
jgi:hypothetical protein